ncbi:hypothetical protein ES703_60529 [subsurface metagenome]
MAIKSPTTYGDYYWASQVEARKLYEDDMEKVLAGEVSSLYETLGVREFLPANFSRFIDSMIKPTSFAWGGVLARFGSEMADSVLGQTMGHALKDFNYMMAEKFSDQRIGASIASTLSMRRQIDDDFWASRMVSEGYKPAEASYFYQAMKPYPSIPDLMLYARYHGDPDNVRGVVWDYFDISPEMFDVWEWQTIQRLATDQVQSLFKRGMISEGEFYTELAQIGWDRDSRDRMKELSYLLPNAMLLVQGDLQQGVSQDKILLDISKADIHPEYARTYLDAILTKPATQDLINFELRRDPNLSGIERRLSQLGIHPDYFEVYKTLAHPIPPIADIITMAVREAFTPAIAARFGQYEDFPSEFEDWALKKGLTADWAKRYWAAHWALPSATQGFSMLHRGIIDDSELRMLLRAQDVMPFWRDKLIKVAYRPLTRVDVRRMYKEGVLDERGVYRAYLDHGYSEDNAEAMTEFTVRYVLGQLTKFTSKDVITAYTKRMVTESEAGSLLRELGVRSEDVSYILSTADYKRSWELTDSKISGLRNLYKRKVNDANKTRGDLLKLDLPTEQVDVLMDQWYYEIKDEPTMNWTTAQTLRFIKSEFISKQRGRKELEQIGYDDEHISIYMKSIA